MRTFAVGGVDELIEACLLLQEVLGSRSGAATGPTGMMVSGQQ
jgi:hypothetical protein